MFRIATVLRNSESPNVFRKVLLGAFASKAGDDFLLCSGFFQERNYKRGPFFASSSISSALGVVSPPGVTITTVGAYDGSGTGSHYDDFVTGLKSVAHVTINKRRKRRGGNQWHAKVFIARNGAASDYRLVIVGSSNITRNAFGEEPGWNRECDVLMWKEGDAAVDNVVRAAAVGLQPGSVIVSTYDEQDDLNGSDGLLRQAPFRIRAERLWNDVMAASEPA